MTEKILHYMFFCHRLPERSFFFRGKQFPICARCTGILIGYIFGILGLILFKNQSLIIGIALIIPLAIDGMGQLHGYWVSNNTRRLLTGILAGYGTICFLVLFFSLGRKSAAIIINLIN